MAKKSTKKAAEAAAKKHPGLVAAVAIILVIIIAAAAILWFVRPDIYHKYIGTGEHTFTEWDITVQGNCGKRGEKKRVCTVCGEEQTEVIFPTGNHDFNDEGICKVCGKDNIAGDLAGVSSSELSIHFLELGNKETGDSILIKCGNTEVLIDAGSQQGSSATAIKEYVDKYCTDGKLEYVISTHADTDHIAAFVGNKQGNSRTGILYQYEIGTFIKFDYTEKEEYTEKGNLTLYGEYLNAVSYIADKGTQVFTASQCYDETVEGAQRQYFLDSEQKISINILYNYYYYHQAKDENDHSVVTLLTEELEEGRRNYLFTGDLEEDGESRMVDYYTVNYKNMPAEYKTEYNVLPEVDLYKAGHHGSKTSSTEKLLEVIKPKYVAVCCCCGSPQYTTANANTFPTQIMLDNVGKYTDKIYVTTIATGLPAKDEKGDYVSKSYGGFESMNGTIVFYSTQEKLKLYCSNNDTILKDTEWFQQNRVWNGI